MLEEDRDGEESVKEEELGASLCLVAQLLYYFILILLVVASGRIHLSPKLATASHKSPFATNSSPAQWFSSVLMVSTYG
jgi:hypothetical protein